jgi:hypothetical protein
MRVEPDGLPKVGTASKCLGVRVPPNPNSDVGLDGAGNVLLDRRGLSVSQDWHQLPGHLIPEHLDDGFNGASGRGMNVFVHGAGPFDEGAVAVGLELKHKAGTTTAGVVTPDALVPVAQYQQALAATRTDWVVDES